MQDKALAERVVGKMYDEDRFSQWLGIERWWWSRGIVSCA
jgi:hypothetical protein